MTNRLSPGIKVVSVHGGRRFILPNRVVPALRPIAVVILILGGFMSVFMLFWMAGPMGAGLRSRGPGMVLPIIFSLLGLPGLAIGAGIFAVGAGILAGRTHSEVEINTQFAAVSEYAWAFHWTWRKPRGLVKSVALHAGLSGSAARRTAHTFAPDLGAIGLMGGQRALLAGAAYPHAILEPLAAELARELDIAQVDRAQPLDLTSGNAMVVNDETIPGKPDKSAIVMQTLPDGIAFAVPPAGLIKGSRGLFIIAAIWDAASTAFLVAAVLGNARDDDGTVVGPILGALLFMSIGAAMSLAAINMGTRKALIAAKANRLIIRRSGLFGASESIFAAREITDIKCGPSGMEINDTPVMELQVHAAGGKKGFLSQRTNDEILWIAANLRHALNITPSR